MDMVEQLPFARDQQGKVIWRENAWHEGKNAEEYIQSCLEGKNGTHGENAVVGKSHKGNANEEKDNLFVIL